MSLVLIFILVFAALVVLFWAGGMWFQAYIYSEPGTQMEWRAPAAALALTLFFALWSFLYGRAPDRYDRLFAFSPNQVVEFPVPRKDKEPARFWSEAAGKRSLFEQRKTQGLPEYREKDGKARKWTRSDAVIVEENGQEVRFDAERDEKGNYKKILTPPPKGLGWLMGPGPEMPLRYLDPRGRIMSEDTIGRLSTFRWSVFLIYGFLTLFHLVIWFIALWLLLRFQWSHALGLAFIFWLVSTLVIVPMLLDAVDARKRPQTTLAIHHFGDGVIKPALITKFRGAITQAGGGGADVTNLPLGDLFLE